MRHNILFARATVRASTVLVAAVSVLSGCWSSETASLSSVSDTTAQHEQTSVVLPEVKQTPVQIREEMKVYEPFSPEFEESRLKLAVTLEKIRKSQGVEGFETAETSHVVPMCQTAYVDPKTHKLYWRALACWNPDCPGRGRGGGPFLFSRECSHITAGSDGDLVIGAPDMAEMMKPINCPACKSDKFIRPYDLPEAMVRERELKAELKRVYEAYAQAAKNGRSMPADMRPPGEIMKDLQAVPKLYLLAEPDKVKKFDAFTAPVAAGLTGSDKP